MKEIKLFEQVGAFAENKDIARSLRIKQIIPILESNEVVTIDFDGVEITTQSFIHALISDIIRKHGIDIIDKIKFKNCNENIKRIIHIVIDYMQVSD